MANNFGSYRDYDHYSQFAKDQLEEALKGEESISQEIIMEKARSNTELQALTEQYLNVYEQISRCCNKEMSNPVYRDLIKEKTKLLIKIHKFFPGKNDSDVINYLNTMLSYRNQKDASAFKPTLIRTIEYFR